MVCRIGLHFKTFIKISNMLKVLVTGGAGFIGSNLALELENTGYQVTVIDNFSLAPKKNLQGFKGELIKADVTEKEIKGDYAVIFHQAAITDPRYHDDKEIIQKNLQGFKNVLKLAKNNQAKLIYASTAGLYGNGPVPMKEDQEKDILSAYAKSKLQMDLIAMDLIGEMHIVGLRYFNVFGPGESFKGRAASMIYHLRKQMLNNERPRIFKYGEQKRDQIYVKDAVTANLLALEAPAGIYNVGTGQAVTFNKIVEVLNQVLATNLDPEYFDNPYEGTYQNNTQADTARAENILKFKAKYSFEEGVIEYHKFLKDHDE